MNPNKGLTVFGQPDRLRHTNRVATLRRMPAFRKMLDESGIEHVYVESEGTRHEWLTWRRALHDFAPRLFRP